MNDQGRPGLDYPCPDCHLIGLPSPLCHENKQNTKLTPLNALRRLDRLAVKGEPEVEEALARLWKFMIEGK